jgi:hypothetical protein
MLLTVIIAGGLFLGMIAILALGYSQIEQERNGKVTDVPAVQPGHCMLCNAPIRRPNTVDEAVFEVQQRIDTEMQDVAAILGRAGSASYNRLYQS